MLAALKEEEESGEDLLEAARRLAKAFSDLLNAAQPGDIQVSYSCYATSLKSFHILTQ